MKHAMRFTFAVLLLWCTAGVSLAAALSEDAVCGFWKASDGNSILEVARDPDGFSTTIVWLKDPLDAAGKPILDTRNPDAGKRARPILGMKNGDGFRFDGKTKWTGGRIYDPEGGKSYKARMSLSGDTLKLRGYIGVPAIGRAEKFTRCAAIPE